MERARFDCNPFVPAINWVFFEVRSFSISCKASFNSCERACFACSHTVRMGTSNLRRLGLGGGMMFRVDKGWFTGSEAALKSSELS